MDALSPDTQATLLLVGRLGTSDVKPLTTTEYHRLAKELHERQLRPADLLQEPPKNFSIDAGRLSKLLDQGTALALAVERWGQLGIRVISRSDHIYPQRLKARLRGAAAPIIFGAGRFEILDGEAVCIVGSRDATASGLHFAGELGRRCTAEGFAVVSGDARGVDREAMRAALEAGGSVVGVLADSLANAVLSKRHREAILKGRLFLLSPYDPNAPFTVANAMDRNRYMYAISTAAVIVDSDVKGGTWSGAVENLRHGWVPAFVRLGEDVPSGNVRLAEMGLIPLPHSNHSLDLSLRKTINLGIERNASPPDGLPLFEPRLPRGEPRPVDAAALFELFVDRLRGWLSEGAQTEQAIAERFGLERDQAKRWLERAREDRLLRRLEKPVRYASAGARTRSQNPEAPGKDGSRPH